MADVLKEAPDGFGAAAEVINTLNVDDLFELGLEVIKFLEYKVGVINADKWCQKVSESNRHIDTQKTQNIINALTYLFRSSAQNKLSEEDFTAMLATSIVFSDTTRSTLCNVWSQKGRGLLSVNIQEQILGVGQLIDVQWKVGMAVSSDQCRNLNSPYVSLTLTVADPAGNLKTHTLELTMHQFRNFTNQLKEISQVIEMV